MLVIVSCIVGFGVEVTFVGRATSSLFLSEPSFKSEGVVVVFTWPRGMEWAFKVRDNNGAALLFVVIASCLVEGMPSYSSLE